MIGEAEIRDKGCALVMGLDADQIFGRKSAHEGSLSSCQCGKARIRGNDHGAVERALFRVGPLVTS